MIMTKTNAVRMVEAAGLPYRVASYAYDENDLNGMHAAEGIGMPPEQVFKTLVARSDKNQIFVFCIPVCGELNLKKAASSCGAKKIDLLPLKELLPTTGYIRGGCSPIGMKKAYPTWIDETAELYDEIAVSAGARGQQLLLSPADLIQFVGMELADIADV